MLEIRKLKEERFGTKEAYVKVSGFALYDIDKGGYIAFSGDREKVFGILSPYIPLGKRKALQSIIDAGGFVSYDGIEIVNPI